MSDEKVLSVVPYLPESYASADVVGALEDLLARARRGEFKALAAVMLKQDDVAMTSISECHDALRMMGAIRILERRFETEIFGAQGSGTSGAG